jgi:predicted PurR-regulated permease PerM
MGLINAVINLVFVLVLSIYWNVDRVRFERLWLSLLPVEQRRRVRDAWHDIETEIGAYLRSEAIQAVTAGILLYLGLRFFEQPYPAIVAFVAAAAWLIPWLGAPFTVCAVLVSWVPATISGVSPNLWSTAVPAALYTLCVLMFLEFVIEPRLFDRRRFNSLLVVLVTIGSADLLGILGFVLGPPLAAAIQIVAEHFTGLRLPAAERVSEPEPLPLRDRIAHLQLTLSEIPSPRPEVLSLVNRLGDLLEQSERVAVHLPEEVPTTTAR